MLKKVFLKLTPKDSLWFVCNAIKVLKERNKHRGFVRITVNLPGEERLVVMMKLESVSFVLKNLKSINMFERDSVQKNVVERTVLSTMNMYLKNVVIAKKNSEPAEIKKECTVLKDAQPNIDTKKRVYNLHVEDMHMYFVNDILVHNCLDSLRYIIFTYFRPIYDGNGEMDVETYRKWKRDYGWR
jgi:hypothetical protein